MPTKQNKEGKVKEFHYNHIVNTIIARAEIMKLSLITEEKNKADLIHKKLVKWLKNNYNIERKNANKTKTS